MRHGFTIGKPADTCVCCWRSFLLGAFRFSALLALLLGLGGLCLGLRVFFLALNEAGQEREDGDG